MLQRDCRSRSVRLTRDGEANHLEVSVHRSDRPQKVTLSFRTPTSNRGAQLLGKYDDVVKDIHKIYMLGIYDRREYRTRVKLTGRYVRGAYESVMHHLPRDEAYCLSSRNSRLGNLSMKSSEFNFDREFIEHWSSKYEYRGQNKVTRLVKQVRKRGYLRKGELNTVGKWKSPRSAGSIENNERLFVKEVTRFALSTRCDRAAIESLTILDGVGAPTASVILHFFHKRDYPILDFRALWSVSLIDGDKYNYSYALWSKYVEYCREQAADAGVSMRILDRALWQYSKRNQQ